MGYEGCCGLDVHAKVVVAGLSTKGRKEIRTFAPMTEELVQLGDWLRNAGCTHVALESTGGYWKPGCHLLESLLTVILVTARHINAVPGRKTDVRDCEWLADLLRHGLLKASFIPPPEIRELRELVRDRQTVVTEHTAVANRIASSSRAPTSSWAKWPVKCWASVGGGCCARWRRANTTPTRWRRWRRGS